MTDHEDDGSQSSFPPPREVPTLPDASPRPITVPPPLRDTFAIAYAKLVEVHEQQLQNYRDLHDEGGPLGRLHTQLELVLHEVRLIRGDWGSALARILKLEQRTDELEKQNRDLEARVRELEVKPDAPAPDAATTP